MRPRVYGRPRRAVAERSGSHERWLVSYADFITLMFAFFTVMYAISSVDSAKLAPAASSIHSAFAIGPPIEEAAVALRDAGPTPVLAAVVPASAAGLEDVKRRLAIELADAVDSGRIEIAEDARGLVLSLPVEATFAVGSAEVQPDARALIAGVATTLRPLGNALRIEGHTDDVPIRTVKYGSNWELSTARASAVVAFLVTDAQVEPARLSAAGYGEFHPRAANDSPVNRARNRRVDIVVIR